MNIQPPVTTLSGLLYLAIVFGLTLSIFMLYFGIERVIAFIRFWLPVELTHFSPQHTRTYSMRIWMFIYHIASIIDSLIFIISMTLITSNLKDILYDYYTKKNW